MTADQELSIKWEWESAGSVKAPEHRATWARIEIQAGSDCVTLVEDKESGSSRRSVYCPLYPMAEWIAYNWWFLQADTRPAGWLLQDYGPVSRIARSLPVALRARHSIRASGDGFAWPDLLIVPDGDQTRLVWENDQSYGSNLPIRFLTSGDCRVSSERVRHELELLVSEVLTRLSEQGVTGTTLEEEWSAVQQADPEEAEYCRAAARLGLDPYSDAAPYEAEIMQASESLNGELLTDFLDAVDPDNIQSALAWISSQRSLIEEPEVPEATFAADSGVVRELRAHVRRNVTQAVQPWHVGYEQARVIRTQVEPDSSSPLDVDRYISRLTRPGADRGLQAMGRSGGQKDPLVVVGRERPRAATRFTLARALWHCIWDDDPLFVVTSAHTSRQRAERAFAAEMLAPAEGIATLLESKPGVASEEELDQIAAHFDVSPMVVSLQVRNHLLAA